LIHANSQVGFHYAIQTLKQMMYNQTEISAVEIIDKPRHSHRGFMLDSSRHLIPVDEIKQILTVMSLQKMNTFHWHLSDDHGFRIEIDKYPNLNTQGSNRNGSYTSKFMNVEYESSGFYSKDEIKEVVEHAKKCYINIIPEFDIPGHVSAILHAYPEFGCFNNEVDVKTKPGIYKDILCASNPEVGTFVKDVLDEITNLFPHKKIHLGGDEVPKENWLECPCCREKIKKESLSHVTNLQVFFMKEMVDYLKTKGKEVVLWNDTFYNQLFQSNVNCQYWLDGKEKSNLKNAMEQEHPIINSDMKAYYFDYPYGVTPLSKTYNHVSEELAGYSNVIGMECCLWTEWVGNRERLHSLLYPRLHAFSEVSWIEIDSKDYESFKVRLENLKSFYSKYQMELTETDFDSNKIKTKLNGVKHITRMIDIKTILTLRKMKHINKKLIE
jgi:hexosaminidase